ncbi:MAG: conserved rane protein of unknown function [Candidatus Saccharibacteria bacterium]|nr:conserved rane protein of unknown function [Candidatus Saccharibacteria bacterium]
MTPKISPPKTFLQKYGVEILLVTAAFVLLFMLLWFRLGSLTFGNAAPVEVASRQAATSWQAILDNPLYAPYTVGQRLVMLSGHDGITSMRLVTTMWAILAMVLFYIVARQWHSVRVAGLATWLFISSSWFLHTARLATPEILWLVSILALVVLFSPRRKGPSSWLSFPILIATLGAVLYVPGMVWLVLFSLVLRRGNIAEAWAASRNFFVRILSILGGMALVAPLGKALMESPELVKHWLGVDTLESAVIIGKQFLAVPKQLFISGPLDPVHWLGRIPLLSVFETIMFILGAYFYVTHLRAARARFIIILSLLAWLVIGIGGLASLSLIVPVVYLVLTTGIAYMLHEWFKVFPNNPIARSIGIAVIAVAILLTSIYQTRSYFVAWRYSSETATAFTEKL